MLFVKMLGFVEQKYTWFPIIIRHAVYELNKAHIDFLPPSGDGNVAQPAFFLKNPILEREGEDIVAEIGKKYDIPFQTF